MISVGISMLIEDIKVGATSNEYFNKKIQKNVDKNRRLFESKVAKQIEKNYPESKVLQSVKTIGGITLPGEIDVICLYKDIVYVIECKAMNLKYTFKEEQNLLKKFAKESENSFVSVLRNKIDFLYDNLNALEVELGIRNIKKIEGIFVVRYPSLALNIEKTQFPILHISQLNDGIGKI